MKFLLTFVIYLTILFIWGCNDRGNPLDTSQEIDIVINCVDNTDDNSICVNFSTEIQIIFDNNCTSCHNTSNPSSGLDLSSSNSYISLINNDVIVPSNHINSKLWQYINSGDMPPGINNLSKENIDLIAKWINEGAQNN